MNFWTNIDTPLEIFSIFLAFCVVFVNGWTDAPNAICSLVLSGKMKIWQSSLLSGAFNFLGVFLSSIFVPSVAKSIFSIAGTRDSGKGTIVTLACFLTVIIFGIACWFFKMPSSESHALIFSLSGASLAVFKKADFLVFSVISVVVYMVFSVVLSFFLTRILAILLKGRSLPYKRLLVFSSASISFMHGAQDGQKFIGIILVLLGLGAGSASLKAPLALVIIVSLIMLFSTLLGGKRIVESMGEISKNPSAQSCLISDAGSFVSMLICSLLGMPISTGNVKSTSIFACAIANGETHNKKMIAKIFLTSAITLPICFLLGFAFAKIILLFR